MSLEIGKFLKVKVVNVIPKGAVVQLEDGHTELIHLSKISTKFVKNVEDFVQVGDELEAEVIAGTFKDAELSLKHLELRPKYRVHESVNTDSKPVDKQAKPNKSIDEMIAKSNADFESKFKGNKKNNRQNRRTSYHNKQFKDND